jgi:hypothetical protein
MVCYMTDADVPRTGSDAPGPPASDAKPSVQPFLRQAPIPPVDADGIVVLIVGTALFAIAAVVLDLSRARLAAAGDGWWLGVAIAGVALGLLGLAYCWRLRAHRRSLQERVR